MISTESPRRDYHAAFLGHLFHRNESSLRSGYEVGRRAVVDGLSVLDIPIIHHGVFREILVETRSAEMDDVTEAASEFFIEVLATYHMTHGAPGPDTGVRHPFAAPGGRDGPTYGRRVAGRTSVFPSVRAT